MPLRLGSRDNAQSNVSPSNSETVHFQQQGQVDWTNLAASSVNTSVQILSRISAAGIDPFTILMGQAIGGSLLWRDEGRKRFDRALQACQGLAGYRNVLWFGFGVKHVIYILTATDQGATCAALCSCLAECYSSSFAAEIMLEMTKASKPSTETVPSLIQWRNMVNACAGLVTNSTFGLHAEQLMRLRGDHRVISKTSIFDRILDCRAVAHKTRLAESLLGLAKLSRGVLVQMTIIGGADAAFVAAIADWLLGLSIEIREGQDQKPLFRNCATNEQPSLVVLFEEGKSEDALQCVGQVFHLSTANSLIREESGKLSHVILSGRIPWENALEYTFRTDSGRLINMREAVGTAIGSAARIHQAVFEADEAIPLEWRTACHSYFPCSHGSGLVQFILQRLPELECLREPMRAAARIPSPKDAIGKFQAHMTSITTGCGCKMCDQGIDNPLVNLPGTPFCLVFMTHAIIVIGQALSGMVTTLLPMRSGLEMMYHTVIERNNPWNKSRLCHPVAVANILPQPYSPFHLLEQADIIFNGRDRTVSRLEYFMVTAYADNGLCFYLDVLIDPAFSAERAARVHISGGRIEHLGRAYDKVSDGGINAFAPPHRSGLRPAGAIAFPDLGDIENSVGGQLEVLVGERMDGLHMEYGVSHNETISYTFGPANVVMSMCRNEGLVSCRKSGSCPGTPHLAKILKAVKDSQRSLKPFCRLETGSEEIVLVHGDTITQLTAAAFLWNPIIQRAECLACCIRYGVRAGDSKISLIMSKRGAGSLSDGGS